MVNEGEHKSKLREADRLLEKLQIRKELKGKFYYIYPKIFEGLFDLFTLFETDDLFFSLQMHFAQMTLQDYPRDKEEIKINWWLEPNINYHLLVQEIFDDYWASFLCFQHGFTKQAMEILRNTLEVIINLYFMKFCKKEGEAEAIIKWLNGEKRITSKELIIDTVKKIEFLKSENISPYLNQLYSILCMATHSHKKMMTSLTVPGGIWVKEKRMFEPFIVLETRSIFLFVVETELKMVKHFIEQDKKTYFTQKVLETLSKVEEHLKKYSTIIENIKKGYVLHRKQVRLDSGKSILFSLKINNEWEFRDRQIKSLSQGERKDLKNKIEKLLLCDTI